MRRTHAASPATTPAAGRAHLTCGACPHEWGAHNPIGTRYCAVTMAGMLNRGCICVVDVPLFAQRAH